MTAADYAADPDYRSWLRLWQQQRRPQVEFADWLRDRGLDGQADAVVWACGLEDLPRYLEDPFDGPQSPLAGLLPQKSFSGTFWYWCAHGRSGRIYADHLPPSLGDVVASNQDDVFRSFDAAVTALLDGYARWQQQPTAAATTTSPDSQRTP